MFIYFDSFKNYLHNKLILFMNNNNHLSQWKTQFEGFSQANSDNHSSEKENFNFFQQKDLFLKSHASLADTTCDENSPISQRF